MSFENANEIEQEKRDPSDILIYVCDTVSEYLQLIYMTTYASIVLNTSILQRWNGRSHGAIRQPSRYTLTA